MRCTLMIFVLLVAVVSPTLAGPMGPVRPANGKFSVEALGAYDRRELMPLPGAGGECEVINTRPLASLSYGLTDRVELSARLGASLLKLQSPATDGASVKTNTRLAWGGKLAALLMQGRRWSLAAQTDCLVHSGHKNRDRLGATLIDYREWQAGLQLQYRYDLLRPYLGTAYSDCRVRYRYGWEGERSRRRVGVYGGTGCDFSTHCSGFIEGRFLDETGAAAGLRYTF